MGTGDFRINAQARQVLVRNWLELQTITAVSVNGVLYVKGVLHCRGNRSVTSELLQKLDVELRGIREVKRIRWQLENWQQDDFCWRPVAGGANGQRPPRSGSIALARPAGSR